MIENVVTNPGLDTDCVCIEKKDCPACEGTGKVVNAWAFKWLLAKDEPEIPALQREHPTHASNCQMQYGGNCSCVS